MRGWLGKSGLGGIGRSYTPLADLHPGLFLPPLSRGLGSAAATPPWGVAQVSRSPATPPSSAPGSGPPWRRTGFGKGTVRGTEPWTLQGKISSLGFSHSLGPHLVASSMHA